MLWLLLLPFRLAFRIIAGLVVLPFVLILLPFALLLWLPFALMRVALRVVVGLVVLPIVVVPLVLGLIVAGSEWRWPSRCRCCPSPWSPSVSGPS